MKSFNKRTYSYVHGDFVVELTGKQTADLLRDAKEKGYSCQLAYSHLYLNRALDFAGSSAGFALRKGNEFLMIFRDSCAGF